MEPGEVTKMRSASPGYKGKAGHERLAAEFGFPQTPPLVAMEKPKDQAALGDAFLGGKENQASGNTWSCSGPGRSTETQVKGMEIQDSFSAEVALGMGQENNRGAWSERIFQGVLSIP